MDSYIFENLLQVADLVLSFWGPTKFEDSTALLRKATSGRVIPFSV